MAIFLTASATLITTFLSKVEGKILSFVGSTQLASAFAAAIFISLFIFTAFASKAPLKIPGNPNELFIWLGKSLLPVQTITATLLASSGIISGFGLAIANTIASLFMTF